jgi:hypothetical protein
LNYCLKQRMVRSGTCVCLTWTCCMLQAVIQGVWEPSGSSRAYTVPQSLPLTTWQGPAARACMDAGDRVACNSLANLCVLQMYST